MICLWSAAANSHSESVDGHNLMLNPFHTCGKVDVLSYDIVHRMTRVSARAAMMACAGPVGNEGGDSEAAVPYTGRLC